MNDTPSTEGAPAPGEVPARGGTLTEGPSSPARTLCLDTPGRLLYVESGAADLFAVDRGTGTERAGRRHFLCRAEAGALLLCGTSDERRHTVIARAGRVHGWGDRSASGIAPPIVLIGGAGLDRMLCDRG